jgi:hypothetical protein
MPSVAEIFVDALSGSDSNPGSRSRPLKTINRAAQLAIGNHGRNIPTTVTINPGTYRETIGISSSDSVADVPITFQALKKGTVIVKGSDVWTGWQRDPSNPRRYVNAWPYRWGVCPPPPRWPVLPEIVSRREMIFVNDRMLTQVLSADEMAEGNFYVDETSGRAMIWPLAGDDISEGNIEVSVRPKLFEGHHVSSLTLSGIIFEHANPCLSMVPSAAVAVFGGTNVIVEDCTFNWNNWIGFRFDGVTNSTARRLVANYNGELGISGYRLKGVTMEDIETSFNDWRAKQFTDYEPAGGKFFHVHGGVFRNYRARSNQARGLWFDTDNGDVVIENAVLTNNLTGGLFFEASQGPITVKSSRICRNGSNGIESNHTVSVILTDNLIYDNQKSQIFVNSASDRRSANDPDTGATFLVVAQQWSLHGNTIIGNEASQLLYKTYQNSNENSQLFIHTMHSDDNTWYNAASARVFQIDRGGRGHRPENVDFLRWQSETGQDKHSKFEPPSTDPAALCEAP